MKKQVSTAKLMRDYRCAKCASRITEKYLVYGKLVIVCCACNGTEFVHEYEIRKQKVEAREVLDGLPDELAEAMGYSPRPSGAPKIFSLSPPEVEI